MKLTSRVAKLEVTIRSIDRRARAEDLTDEQLKEMSEKSGYRLYELTDRELDALHDCYSIWGKYLPERMTPELAAALERVKV